MARKCCVPGCRSNYRGTKYTSTFRIPKCEKQKELWLRKIPRANFVPNNNSVVCVNHFHKSDIISNENAPNGYSKNMKLKENAVPLIFKGLPSHLTSDKPISRKNPDIRRRALDEKYETAYQEDLQKLEELNKVNCFNDILNFCKDPQNLCGSTYRTRPEKVEFFYIDEKSPPEIKGYIIINNDLSYSAYVSSIQIEIRDLLKFHCPEKYVGTLSEISNILVSIKKYVFI